MLKLVKMLLFCVVFVYIFGRTAVEASASYYCDDKNPQHHVIIDQIMGMWFGVEIIYHQEEMIYKRHEMSCPIIHISADRGHSTTINPLYSNYDYKTNYGPAHGYGSDYRSNYPSDNNYDSNSNYGSNSGYRPGYGISHRPHTTIPMTRTADQEIRRTIYEQEQYDRQTTYGNYPNSRRQHFFDIHRHMGTEINFLRLIWDENGESTEYHMRYNVSQPGFWISSGPENGGASLDPQYSHFAGTIQVLKAVGNHMVLTFCHQLPEKQLYSILLSREINLDYVEIHGVHNMLQRKGLRTNSIKKVCNNDANAIEINIVFAFIGLISCLLKVL